jgi:hypothetical protein
MEVVARAKAYDRYYCSEYRNKVLERPPAHGTARYYFVGGAVAVLGHVEQYRVVGRATVFVFGNVVVLKSANKLLTSPEKAARLSGFFRTGRERMRELSQSGLPVNCRCWPASSVQRSARRRSRNAIYFAP